MFSIEESKQALGMILSCVTSCEVHELLKWSTVFFQWWYQLVTIENYLLPTNTEHYDLRKFEQPQPQGV